MKKTKKPGYWVLNVASVFLAILFLGPIVWALAVSFQHEGKQIKSVIRLVYTAIYAWKLSEDYFQLSGSYLVV